MTQLHTVAMLEVGEGLGELSGAQITEGADDVTPHVDEEGVGHAQIVAQTEANEGPPGWRHATRSTTVRAPRCRAGYR